MNAQTHYPLLPKGIAVEVPPLISMSWSASLLKASGQRATLATYYTITRSFKRCHVEGKRCGESGNRTAVKLCFLFILIGWFLGSNATLLRLKLGRISTLVAWEATVAT